MDYTCLNGENIFFLDDLYKKYLENDQSVDSSWRNLFKQMESNANTKNSNMEHLGHGHLKDELLRLIEHYRSKGHWISQVNPLKDHSQPRYLDHNISDLQQKVDLSAEINRSEISGQEVIDMMHDAHCKNIGLEFMHILNREETDWLAKQVEKQNWRQDFTPNQKKHILQHVLEAELFENYLHVKFPGAKRFSLEGAVSAIASLEAMIDYSSELGVEEIIIGMAHRGRLNVLTKVLRKRYAAILHELQGGIAHPKEYQASGDVKYHLGASCDRTVNGRKVHLSLAANPSHLEAVNGVVMGKVRCKQDLYNDAERNKVMGILLHGDAAFVGQGVVHECFNLEKAPSYDTGGIIHILVNNQIGFTTNGVDARSFFYPAYAGVAYEIPIFHVNGDDPEAVAFCSMIAAEYRHKFKKGSIIGMQCYRKYGHNEGDEPRFTQPKMYQNISQRTSPADKYAQQLIDEGVINPDELTAMKDDFKKFLDSELEKAKSYVPDASIYYSGNWKDFKRPLIGTKFATATGPTKKQLYNIAEKLAVLPEHMTAHDKVRKLLSARHDAVQKQNGIDWGNAEHLAFASLLAEGYNIRLGGQDSRRGTFSHRHAIIVDQNNEERYFPLQHVSPTQGSFEVLDSTLSEYAAMAFEYGYSLVSPKNLVLWEAQFGDFVNGAQIVIDQFISAAETKWLQSSGLVLLLPHGYEGQGPEHSSARLERFLQLCADDNMQIVNCTTPASYFHVLRRQMLNNFRKPLIIFTPKSLLRHKQAISTLNDLSDKAHFQELIPETRNLDAVKKVIFCSGKVYYDIMDIVSNDTAVIRLEQLYPLPKEEILRELKKYSSAEIIWCQEEHKNMGAWFYINQEFYELIGQNIKYVGRKASSSTAVGYAIFHEEERKSFLAQLK